MSHVFALRNSCVVVVFATAIAGCATNMFVPPPMSEPSPVFTQPPPPAPAAVIEQREVSPVGTSPVLARSAPGVSSHLYKLWYATNRVPVMAKSEVVDYSAKWDDKAVHYGSLYAEIPTDFLDQQASMGFLARLFRTAEAKLRLTKPNSVSADSLSADIRQALMSQEPDERQVLIYLHGFNTTYKEAAQRAASIGYQLKIPTTAFFSWPSQGGMLKYLTDKDMAQLSEDSIADFILQIAEQSQATKVHLIAHSMGNYALLGAMYRPKMQQAIRDGLRFGQIILAAPDVDTARFRKDAGVFAVIADRVSLYVSDGDVALETSKKLAPGQARAGLRPPVVVIKNIDTIDVSTTNLTALGHSYVSAEVAVLNDMHSLIMHNEPPKKRAYVLPKDDYWQLK
jgi:esterase/lipase superfamily enzyme